MKTILELEAARAACMRRINELNHTISLNEPKNHRSDDEKYSEKKKIYDLSKQELDKWNNMLAKINNITTELLNKSF